MNERERFDLWYRQNASICGDPPNAAWLAWQAALKAPPTAEAAPLKGMANLSYKLVAASGYESEGEHYNITPEQWEKVMRVLAGTEKNDAEALRKDAERYRWLRDGGADNTAIGVYEWCGSNGQQRRIWLARQELDESIDAALRGKEST